MKVLENWIETVIISERVSESTKEKYQAKTKLLLRKSDIKRIAEHPANESLSLLAADDGANFIVDCPFVKLKGAIVSE